MKIIYSNLLLLILLLSVSTSCSSDDNASQESNFDRQAFLQFMLDEQILPAVTNLESKASSLNALVADFSATPSSQQLQTAKTTWVELASAWQYMHIFDFGASELTTGNLGEEIATFPIDVTEMLDYAENASVLFQNFERDTRGLYAVEYFLFSPSADLNNQNQLAYLKALTERLAQQTSTVAQKWNTTGKVTFLAQNGTDAGSSLSNLVNALAKSYEAIKNFKLGVPLGLRPGQPTSEPSRVEAYYSDTSLALMLAHFNSLANIWKGNANFSDRSGLGFEEYLESVFGGEELKTSTSKAITEINQKFIQIDSRTSLKDAINSEPTKIIELHNLFQQHTRFFKSDLASLLGVSITFNSGDGD